MTKKGLIRDFATYMHLAFLNLTDADGYIIHN